MQNFPQRTKNFVLTFTTHSILNTQRTISVDFQYEVFLLLISNKVKQFKNEKYSIHPSIPSDECNTCVFQCRQNKRANKNCTFRSSLHVIFSRCYNFIWLESANMLSFTKNQPNILV